MIILSATFEVCDCGKHGRFELPDGTLSEEFCSEEDARHELQKLLNENRITDAERLFLTDCVRKSKLPLHQRDADIVALITCKINNEISAMAQEEIENDEDTPQYRVH